jgi:dipeptidyl-peptidase-4
MSLHCRIALVVATIILAPATFPARARAAELTLERIMGSPALSGPVPRGLALSPDGKLATLLEARADDRDRYDLWALDTATGAKRMLVDSTKFGGGEISEEEKMRRERARVGGTRGVISYAWAPDSKSILVPLDGDLYLATTADGTVRRLTDTAQTELDAKISPRGRFVSFVRDQNLFLYDLATGTERALTTDGAGAVSWGSAEFVAQEEMDRRDGHWWSPDDKRLVVAKVDETEVRMVPRASIGADGTRVFEQRYPRAGTSNARVELFVFDADAPTGKAPWKLDLGPDADIYVARVDWRPDGKAIVVQRQSRDQKRLDLLEVDPDTGESATLLSETSPTWVNLSDDLRFLGKGPLLWTSERDGFRHLYTTGHRTLEQLTSGPWGIDKIVGVDEARRRVYFIAGIESPIERHLYSVDLTGGGRATEPVRLTEPGGWHDVSMDKTGSRALITRSTPTQPPQTYLADADGKRIAWIEENRVEGEHPYAPFLAGHIAPEFGTLAADDGTPLHYAHLKPSLAPGEKAPALVIVYGGPGVGPLAARRWGNAVSQWFVRRGWHVFSLDNRGTSGRGKAFEDPIHLKMGDVEVRDQKVGVDWLRARADVDADRIAVHGWSYGGYMVLRLLAAHPGLFAAGASGAPVTDWSLYDTHYTERYLGNPAVDRAPYETSGVLGVAGAIADPLLLIHGMADDNVVFENTTALVAKMQKDGTLFEVMIYPGQTHGISGAPDRIHLWRTIADFFDRRLGLPAAPRR